jgi:hypothetical protein
VARYVLTAANMNTFALVSFAFLGFTLAACATPASEADGSTASALSTWTTVSSCDNGAMVVDIAGYPMTPAAGHDPEYAVQAVIRDEGILKYLESRGAIARNPANHDEAIIPGHIWLSTFNTPRFDGAFPADATNGVTAKLTRYGSGIKLTFDQEQPDNVCPSFCSNPSDPDYDPTSGVCEGCVGQAGQDEIANWWFASCPVLADIHR